jgi:hypothetical protein
MCPVIGSWAARAGPLAVARNPPTATTRSTPNRASSPTLLTSTAIQCLLTSVAFSHNAKCTVDRRTMIHHPGGPVAGKREPNWSGSLGGWNGGLRRYRDACGSHSEPPVVPVAESQLSRPEYGPAAFKRHFHSWCRLVLTGPGIW